MYGGRERTKSARIGCRIYPWIIQEIKTLLPNTVEHVDLSYTVDAKMPSVKVRRIDKHNSLTKSGKGLGRSLRKDARITSFGIWELEK